MSQHKCTIDLLKEVGKIACKPVSTPVDQNQKLGRCEESPSETNR